MSLKKLRSGFIDTTPSTPEAQTASPGKLLKRALLVYEGEFESMDGPVEVNRNDLDLLATNHNAQIAHAIRLAGEGAEVPMKEYPPLQLDHSTSAKDTIGRLVGEIEVHPYIRKDGKEVMAAYGNVLVLGAENIEKVQDGRWTHLSVGVDFEKGRFSELTVTPFPAAPEASLLSKTGDKISKTGDKMNRLAKWSKDSGMAYGYLANCEVADSEDQKYFLVIGQEERGSNEWIWAVGLSSSGEIVASNETNSVSQAKSAAESAAKSRGAKLSIIMSWKKLKKGELMDTKKKEKLKKHLMEKEKLSAEDAEAKLSKLMEDEEGEEMKKLAAEVDEEEKKLAAEEAEKAKLAAEEVEKAEKEQKQAKMAAAKETLSRLSSDFRKSAETVNLAAKKGSILTRLSKLRAEAKVTPAEIKKMDLDKLSKEGQAVIDAVLKTYEDREPVIMVGAMGSLKAENIGNLSKPTRMSRLEEETRANMSLLKGTIKDDKTKRLAEMPLEPVNIHIDTSPHVDESETEYNEMSRLLDEGKIAEVKEKMKKWMKKSMSYGSSSEAQLSSVETEKQISSLAESAKRMQTQFEELHKLAASLVGNQ